MSSDKWPIIAAVGAAAAAAAAFGQVIVAAVQAGQQSEQDSDIKDLQERVRAIEQQIREAQAASSQGDETYSIRSISNETMDKFRDIQHRAQELERLDRRPLKEELGEILAQLEGTLDQSLLINPDTLPKKKSWLNRYFESKGAEYLGRRYD